jgi:S-DNA-T family DNA segregation ATPase FtsK/SpoIIIE
MYYSPTLNAALCLSSPLHAAIALVAVLAVSRPLIFAVRFAVAPAAARAHYPGMLRARLRWRWLCRNTVLAPVEVASKNRAAVESDRGVFFGWVLMRTLGTGLMSLIGVELAARERAGRVHYPRIRKLRADAYGWQLTMKTVPRTGRREVERAAPWIADAWRCKRVAVSQPKPGRVIVRGIRRDPLALKFGAEGAPAGQYEHADPASPYLGLSEWADQRFLSLAGQTGIVVGGLPGRGKSSLVGSLLAQWAGSPAVQFAIADGKGSDDYADWTGRAWLTCGDDLAGAVKFFEACHALMKLRLSVAQARTGVKNTWHLGPSEAWPLVVVIVDECQQFLDGQAVKGRKPDEEQVRKCQFYVSQLVRKSRSVMMVTILATQKPTIDSIPSGIRDNAGISLAFGVKTVESATAVLGADIRDYASFSPVGLQADELVGCLTSTLKTGADPFTRIRVPEITAEQAAARARETAHLRRDPFGLLAETAGPVVAEPAMAGV